MSEEQPRCPDCSSLEDEILRQDRKIDELTTAVDAGLQELIALRASLSRLVATWRSQGRSIDSFHATMGSGYWACANDLEKLL